MRRDIPRSWNQKLISLRKNRTVECCPKSNEKFQFYKTNKGIDPTKEILNVPHTVENDAHTHECCRKPVSEIILTFDVNSKLWITIAHE